MSPHLNRHQFVVFFSDSSINMAKSAPLDSNITLGTEQISVSIQWIEGGKGHGFENLLADQFAHPVSLFKTLPHLAWTNSHLGDFLQHFIIDSQPKVLIFYYLRNCLIIWFIIRIYLVEVISVGKGEALDRNWGKILRFIKKFHGCKIIREAMFISKLFYDENEVWTKVDRCWLSLSHSIKCKSTLNVWVSCALVNAYSWMDQLTWWQPSPPSSLSSQFPAHLLEYFIRSLSLGHGAGIFQRFYFLSLTR